MIGSDDDDDFGVDEDRYGDDLQFAGRKGAIIIWIYIKRGI